MLIEPPVAGAGHAAFADALDFLFAAQRDHLDLAGAQRRFRQLRERHPDVVMELLWEEERYAGTVHYDVLLRPPGGGTVSLGFAAERAVPWLLRTAQHSHECDVARVNSQTLDIQTVVSYLDLLWGDTHLMQQMVDDMLVDEGIAQYGIEASPSEAQRAMDELRASLGLHSAADTARWMERHSVSHDRLEWIASRGAAAAALRERVISDDAVTRYLEQHATNVDAVQMARFRMPDAAEARDAVAAITGGHADFFEMAQRRFLATGADGGRAGGGELFATATRGSLSVAQAEQLFGAEPGDVVGPVESGDGYDVVRILAVTRARPDDPAARAAARQALFADWLAARRESASVEWFWGNAGHASER